MNQRTIGRELGRQASSGLKAPELRRKIQEQFDWTHVLYPTFEGDLAVILRDFDRERLACEPDYTKFPEMRGLLDRHIGEREGFMETPGFDETCAAFHYSWNFLLFKRLNSQHPSDWQAVLKLPQCTNVFFPNGRDGVTISDNRDLGKAEARLNRNWQPTVVPWCTADQFCQGGASSAICMDEDPSCCFPCDPDELCPPEAWDDLNVRIEFMTRYREFWGPGNRIWIDRHRNAVAVDKSNCRVGFHYPQVNGAVCITACSYLDPDLHAFKEECLRKMAKLRGQTEATSPDLLYNTGSRRRYRRLWDQTNAAAAIPGGPTIWDALNIVADEAVPYPDRICLAGQDTATWSFLQHAGVTSGDKRRWLYRIVADVENPTSVTEVTPKLLLGEGIEMQPDWQADVDAGRCELVSPSGVDSYGTP
ncbi:MAG: hypothetical protein QF773_03620 [Lentisphaeria bacterium]|nr:hypothetical protein [Lentisphaeria bacterium]